MTESSKSEQELIQEIPQANSEVLAAHVVVYRTLGINRELAKACMQELANRRKFSDFDYEGFIEEKVKEIPLTKKLDTVKTSQAIQKQVQGINVRRVIQTNDSKNFG